MREGRPASDSERAAILAAIPEPARSGRGIASVLVEKAGSVIDGAVVLDHPDDVFVRPLPDCDRDALDLWITLLERRRNQLAHDVSGPATGVLAALETVLEYEPIPSSAASILRDARVGMMRLSRLLADRSSALAANASFANAVLVDSVAAALRPLSEMLDPHRERLLVEITGDHDVGPVDATLVEGALSVLVTNAWKFRKGNSVHVAVEATRVGGYVRLVVSDDGRGFEGDALRRAGELGFSTRSSGVGLGLFLLRRAVCSRGGALLLERGKQGANAAVIVPDHG